MDRFSKIWYQNIRKSKRGTRYGSCHQEMLTLRPDYGPLNAKNAPDIPKAKLDKFKGPESGNMLTFLGDMVHKIPLFCSSKCFDTKFLKIYP